MLEGQNLTENRESEATVAILPLTRDLESTASPEPEDQLADFWKLWNDSEPLLMKRALKLLNRHREDAEDAMSTCRLKAARAFDRAPHAEPERVAWLYRVLTNVCLDLHREKARTKRGLGLASTGEARIVAPAIAITAEERLHRRRALEIVLTEGAKLPRHLRRALLLKVALGWSYVRIARHQKISESNARKRVQLARGALMKRLEARGLIEPRRA